MKAKNSKYGFLSTAFGQINPVCKFCVVCAWPMNITLNPNILREKVVYSLRSTRTAEVLL